jgi:hypothetical protein
MPLYTVKKKVLSVQRVIKICYLAQEHKLWAVSANITFQLVMHARTRERARTHTQTQKVCQNLKLKFGTIYVVLIYVWLTTSHFER